MRESAGRTQSLIGSKPFGALQKFLDGRRGLGTGTPRYVRGSECYGCEWGSGWVGNDHGTSRSLWAYSKADLRRIATSKNEWPGKNNGPVID